MIAANDQILDHNIVLGDSEACELTFACHC